MIFFDATSKAKINEEKKGTGARAQVFAIYSENRSVTTDGKDKWALGLVWLQPELD